MSKSLYFVTAIAKALEQPDSGRALKEAFREIVRKGQFPEFVEGYAQFERFMDLAYRMLESSGQAHGDVPDRTLQESRIALLIERHGTHLSRFPMLPAGGTFHVENILPGQYALKMDTGTMLWTGELTEKELTWSKAFPGRPLDLAADTGESARKASLTVTLLSGEIELRVFPGIRAGSMEIKVLSEG